MAKDRGIEHIVKRNGDILNLVKRMIKKKGKVKILEAGCGHGVAMMGFVKEFGNKVELIGFNYSKQHGDVKIMRQQAINKAIFTKSDLNKIKNIPKIIYLDADKKLPFRTGEFDIIYSIATVYLIRDKVKFFEECYRVLDNGGVARLQPGWAGRMAHELNPKDYHDAWEIWDSGKIVKAYNYFRKIKNVKVGFVKREASYLEFKKGKMPEYGLNFIAAIDTNYLWTKFMGVKSIYSTQGKFKPHWKR